MRSWRTSSVGSKRSLGLIALLAGLLVLSSAGNLAFGAVPIPLREVVSALLGRGEGTHAAIILYARLPRLCGCLLAGAALACSGVIIQGVLNNPLAAPNIIGVNSGAGLATAICCAVAPGAVRLTPVAAFAGALAGVLLVLVISERAGAARITLVLAGVAISSMFSAGIDAVVTFFPDALSGYTDFRIGGVRNLSMARLTPAFWVILIALIAALSLSNELDLLLLGRETAQSLGLSAKGLRLVLLMLAAALAGAAVSFSGLLGFVGLLAPHIMRRLLGEESFPLLLSSALGGALLLTACDLASRLLFAPFELPLGVVMSLAGGPFFIWLLLRQRRGGGGP
ncbi:iron ABC transporter permease [Pseudoflavonifractor sp. 60]|uniref:FecCD family ABC transporter permease n=1 Tax=Pseudoflavonifractor sp. 60 TaxID=2304576 RepID=UPI001369FBFD|nr:iron ABC transporter permease [Pseudoflavonifractor sp. 60]NBI68796.1 iron ABC transporter permease [Pseudoflavonifractor sp. 60]